MKKIVFTLMLIFITVFFSSCESVQSSDNTSLSNKVQGMTKYEVVLTLDNYLSFFDINSSIINGQTAYSFKGCLSYAFYDNVSVYFECITTYSFGEPEKETIILKLNAAGNGDSPKNSGNVDYKIVNISGTVIYWM